METNAFPKNARTPPQFLRTENDFRADPQNEEENNKQPDQMRKFPDDPKARSISNLAQGETQKEVEDLASAKIKLEEENKNIRIQLLMAEERLADNKKEQEKLQNEVSFYKEESEKAKAKNKVIELYASDLQRKLDILTQDIKERTEDLEKLKSNDWTKRLMECNGQIEQMRDQLLEQERQYNELKSQLTAAAQMGSNNKKHFETFIEEQSKELLKARKIVLKNK